MSVKLRPTQIDDTASQGNHQHLCHPMVTTIFHSLRVLTRTDEREATSLKNDLKNL